MVGSDEAPPVAIFGSRCFRPAHSFLEVSAAMKNGDQCVSTACLYGGANRSCRDLPEESEEAVASIYLACVLLQEIIWQRSASELQICGPEKFCQAVKEAFSAGGACEFEALQVLYSQETEGRHQDGPAVPLRHNHGADEAGCGEAPETKRRGASSSPTFLQTFTRRRSSTSSWGWPLSTTSPPI